MKVISVVNHKGGVGKTTTTFNFAAELAKRGNRVLLIDFDMQGNLSSAFGLSEEEIEALNISNLIDQKISNNGSWEERLDVGLYSKAFHEDFLPVDIVPCGIDMANTLLKLNSMMARELYLKMVLDEITSETCKYGKEYDYCIIDCAPSVMIDFQNTLVASDEVLIVANPDTFSTSGMTSLLREYGNVAKYFNHNLKIAGVLINNADNKTVFTKTMISMIKDVWKDLNVFETIIPSSIRVKESLLAHLPICVYEPQNPVSAAFSSFTDEYLKKDLSSPYIEKEEAV